MSDRLPHVVNDLSDASYSRIAAHLLRGSIQPGDLIPSEAILGKELSMGRQQVREGLSVLEAFGAVAARQGARRVWRGYDLGAAMLTASSMRLQGARLANDLLEVRHALETALLPSAALRIGPDDLVELRLLAQQMVDLAERGRSFAESDALFHRRLFASLGNSVLDGILMAFWAQFDEMEPRQSAVVDPAVAAMHKRIVDALEAGDQRLAVHELDAHFYGVRQALADDARNDS